MTLKEAIESGKPFRRESWQGSTYFICNPASKGDVMFWECDAENITGTGTHIPTVKDICATDWVLKYDCEECKDTKIIVITGPGIQDYKPCPKCSAPKYKCETCKDTKVVRWVATRKVGEDMVEHPQPCPDCSASKKEPQMDKQENKIVGGYCKDCVFKQSCLIIAAVRASGNSIIVEKELFGCTNFSSSTKPEAVALPKMKKITVYRPVVDVMPTTTPLKQFEYEGNRLYANKSDYNGTLGREYCGFVFVGWKEEVIEVLDEEAPK